MNDHESMSTMQKLIAKGHSLVGELKNRRVIRTVGGYIALIWLLSQGFSDLFPVFGFPDWSLRAFITLSVLAIPIVALLSWKYDVTSQGLVVDERSAADSKQGIIGEEHSGVYDQKTLKSGSTDHFVEVSWRDSYGELNRMDFVHSFLIGRDTDVDIRVVDPRVSRRHVKVCSLDGEWYIQDLNSSNGTYCDGVKIDMQDLEDQCRLRLAPDGPVFDISLQRFDDAKTPMGADAPATSISDLH